MGKKQAKETARNAKVQALDMAHSRYVTCPKKGNHRKHVDVCRRCCHRVKRCKAYDRFFQPRLFKVARPESLQLR